MRTSESSRGVEAQRLALVVALVLTVVAIATGTWMLGSGTDPEDPTVPVVAELGGPQRSLAPLSVAPPPEAAADRASRKAEQRAKR